MEFYSRNYEEVTVEDGRTMWKYRLKCNQCTVEAYVWFISQMPHPQLLHIGGSVGEGGIPAHHVLTGFEGIKADRLE